MHRLRKYSLLLAIFVANTLSFGDGTHCGLNQPEVKLKSCLQKLLDDDIANLTEWTVGIRQRSFLRLPSQVKNGNFHSYSIRNARVLRSHNLFVEDLTVQGVNTSHVSVRMSASWERLGVRMGVKAFECGTTLLVTLCTNITGFMNIPLRNATASVTATWQIADSTGTPSIKPAGVEEVKIMLNDRDNNFVLNVEPQATRSSDLLDQIYSIGEKNLRNYTMHVWRNIYKPSMKMTLKKAFEDTSYGTFIPELTRMFGEHVVRMA